MPAATLPRSAPGTVDEVPGYLASFTNYEQMKKLPRSRRALGPERAAHLLRLLGLERPTTPIVQVAGSKGKGSTVLWLEALLLVRGERPGAFLSPHLERISERIRVAGTEVDERAILVALQHIHEQLQLVADAEPKLFPTFFDLWTCLAMLIFQQARVSHILLEVGLGGPLDSTSAVPHQVGVLTSIDLEHRLELGDTLDDIAREKARIARSDRPFIIADLRESWGREAARQAQSQGAEICAAPIDHRIPRQVEAPQDRNLAVALATLEAMDGVDPFTEHEVRTAADSICLAGRLEELSGPPPVLLDSAHTRKSMAYFQRRFMAWRGARPGAVLIGFVDGKSWRDAVDLFEQDGDGIEWIVTTPEPRRRLDPKPIAQRLSRFAPDVHIEEDVEAAIALLRERARRGCALGVTGSFFLSGKVRSHWFSLPA